MTVQAHFDVTVPEHLRLELARIAREAETSEDEMVRQAIEALVLARRGPGIPRFARRLGPVALERQDPSPA